MTIEAWAQKVAKAVMILPGERAPVDTVLVDHLDEFEELARTTRLKIPAFARALTAAGLNLASGSAYDGATLRTQINRARSKRRSQLGKDDSLPAPRKAGTISRSTPEVTKSTRPLTRGARGPAQLRAKSENDSILARLERSKPRRVRSLDHDEE
jgi:hypothetical protein